jgi:hypothetical protein
MPPSIPAKNKIDREDKEALTPVSSRVTKYKVGQALATEGEEVTIREIYITNDAGETIVGFRETLTMTDETDGTEDTTFKQYHLINGSLTEI